MAINVRFFTEASVISRKLRSSAEASSSAEYSVILTTEGSASAEGQNFHSGFALAFSLYFCTKTKVNFVPFIRDVVVAISAMVIVVVSIAEVPAVPSRSEVSCAKHKVHGIAPKLMTECHHQESHLTSNQFNA